MEPNEIIILVTRVIFYMYVLAVWLVFGLHKSISKSYLTLKKHNVGVFFFILCAALGIMIFNVSTGILPAIAAFFIIAVGVASQITDTFIHKIHMVFAIGSISFVYLSIIIDNGNYMYPLIFAVGAIIILIFDRKNYIWWIEILAFEIIVRFYNIIV